jgi:hypothetical protein
MYTNVQEIGDLRGKCSDHQNDVSATATSVSICDLHWYRNKEGYLEQALNVISGKKH